MSDAVKIPLWRYCENSVLRASCMSEWEAWDGIAPEEDVNSEGQSNGPYVLLADLRITRDVVEALRSLAADLHPQNEPFYSLAERLASLPTTDSDG